tara:strand:- start:322 stop:543 length:222 start_codon:yes stop_codon:yes gene_type:complete
MQAKPLHNAVNVKSAEILPNGVKVVTLDCADWMDFVRTPNAINYDGQTYGCSGWNSDSCVAYYRTDKKVAFSS